MATGPPSAQNVIDLFAGEWSSRMPPGSGLVSGGVADLFDDARVTWADAILGPLQGMEVLELGPLEGGHSYLMQQRGARSITAIEANRRAFLRLLCVKEVFGLHAVHPLLGDFVSYLEESPPRRFDLVFASGVLYHMTEPLRLLEQVCGATDRLFLWTHYYDTDAIAARDDAALFDGPLPQRQGRFTCDGFRRAYPDAALAWSGFSGGAQPFAVWLTRDGILDFLRGQGFTRIETAFDHRQHQNGPALGIAARR